MPTRAKSSCHAKKGVNVSLHRSYLVLSFLWACAFLASTLQRSMASPRIYLRCDRDLRIRQLAITKSQIGVRETGRNSGAVTRYLRAVGLPSGNPYCAAGIYWSFDSASSSLGLAKSAIPIPRTGLASRIYSYAKANGVRCQARPAIGDLIVWQKPSSIFGHVGQILLVRDAGWVTTIEYNTGNRSQREGDGVWTKQRNIYHPLGRMRTRGIINFRS